MVGWTSERSIGVMVMAGWAAWASERSTGALAGWTSERSTGVFVGWTQANGPLVPWLAGHKRAVH
eukprot:13594101-Alexandrium_andersonii.AAC.1